ncbi:hypothetical protein ABIE50_003900 [Chitinophaga sp. OAE865]
MQALSVCFNNYMRMPHFFFRLRGNLCPLPTFTFTTAQGKNY